MPTLTVSRCLQTDGAHLNLQVGTYSVCHSKDSAHSDGVTVSPDRWGSPKSTGRYLFCLTDGAHLNLQVDTYSVCHSKDSAHSDGVTVSPDRWGSPKSTGRYLFCLS